MTDVLGRAARVAGRLSIALVVTLLAASCGATDITLPGDDAGARLALSDGANGDGNPDFFFLPPMVPDPSGEPSFDADAFDGSLSPRVEICALDGEECADPQPGLFPVVFDMTSRHGSTRVRVDEDEEHYIVNWHTRLHALDAETDYRIAVWVDAVRLGFADVDVVEGGNELSGVDEEVHVAVKNGRTLPIKFRIEHGALVPPSTDIVVDGSGRRFGPLPAITYALAENADGEDLYPLGDGAFYLFGLYDTGSTRVRLFNEIPYFFTAFPDPNGGLVRNVPNRLTDGNFFDGDASLLGIDTEVQARVRLNGLGAIDPATLTAPIGLGAAQLEVSDVAVRPETGAPALDVTLIGGALNQSVVAFIDYTTEVVRSGYPFYPGLTDPTPAGTGIPDFSPIDAVSGPDITFHAPGDPDVPSLPLEIPLTRIGTPAVRYGLVGVEMVEGPSTFSDTDPSLPPPVNVLFDTGTTITIIGDVVADVLALTTGGGTFDCLGGTANGYEIDAVRLIGPSGTYTVTNASVCWRQEALPAFLTAVTGSNLFDQVPMVFDGAGDRLWIGEPTATPVSW